MAEKTLGEREKEAKVSAQSVSIYIGLLKVALFHEEILRAVYRENIYSIITT